MQFGRHTELDYKLSSTSEVVQISVDENQDNPEKSPIEGFGFGLKFQLISGSCHSRYRKAFEKGDLKEMKEAY